METTVAGAAHNFSMYDMLWNADPVVKGVMLLLAIASVVCWAIILEKMFRLAALNRGLRDLEAISKSPAGANVKKGLSRTILSAAESEVSDGAKNSLEKNVPQSGGAFCVDKNDGISRRCLKKIF